MVTFESSVMVAMEDICGHVNDRLAVRHNARRFRGRVHHVADSRELGAINRLEAPGDRSARVPRIFIRVVRSPGCSSSAPVIRVTGRSISVGQDSLLIIFFKEALLSFAEMMFWFMLFSLLRAGAGQRRSSVDEVLEFRDHSTVVDARLLE